MEATTMYCCWDNLDPPNHTKQKAFCISWSRDQLSVNTKTVRFWNILLARAKKSVLILGNL